MNTHKAKFIDATPYLPFASIKYFQSLQPKFYRTALANGRQLKNKRIVHLAASRIKKVDNKCTVGGGGLSEILKNQIPLENSIGLRGRLLLLSASKDFYTTSKEIFNCLLENANCQPSEKSKKIFQIHARIQQDIIRSLFKKHSPDILVVHDFHCLPAVLELPPNSISILHWHINFPHHQSAVVDFLKPWIKKFDFVIVPDAEKAKRLGKINQNVKIVSPAINPLGAKMKKLDRNVACRILTRFNINCSKPILAQVGRFSSQKGTLDAVNIYLSIRQLIPDLQLILAGLFKLPGDLDFAETLAKVEKYARSNPNIFVFSEPYQLQDISNDTFINSIYTAGDIILNMSSKEGFGLTTTEAMWKKKVVVARKSPGSLSQINNDKSGIIALSLAEASRKVIKLLQDSKERNRLGNAAHRVVRSKFLIIRYLSEITDVYKSFPI